MSTFQNIIQLTVPHHDFTPGMGGFIRLLAIDGQEWEAQAVIVETLPQYVTVELLERWAITPRIHQSVDEPHYMLRFPTDSPYLGWGESDPGGITDEDEIRFRDLDEDDNLPTI